MSLPESIFGWPLVINIQGGSATYQANATDCVVPLSLNASQCFCYTFVNSRYSVSTAAHYDAETFFNNNAGIITKMFRVATTGAVSYVTENTSFKYIAIGWAV